MSQTYLLSAYMFMMLTYPALSHLCYDHISDHISALTILWIAPITPASHAPMLDLHHAPCNPTLSLRSCVCYSHWLFLCIHASAPLEPLQSVNLHLASPRPQVESPVTCVCHARRSSTCIPAPIPPAPPQHPHLQLPTLEPTCRISASSSDSVL